jgi:hypothetical protein
LLDVDFRQRLVDAGLKGTQRSPALKDKGHLIGQRHRRIGLAPADIGI